MKIIKGILAVLFAITAFSFLFEDTITAANVFGFLVFVG